MVIVLVVVLVLIAFVWTPLPTPHNPPIKKERQGCTTIGKLTQKLCFQKANKALLDLRFWIWGFWQVHQLSGPVLRDTARLSQRYTLIARYGVFGVSTWPIGCDTPSPFSESLPLGEHQPSGGAIPPLKRGISAILARYRLKTRQMGAIPPSAILLGPAFGRTDFSRIFIFEPPDFFADFLAGFFRLAFVGKSAQKNPPGKSPGKSSKIYTTKILQHISADWPGQILSRKGIARYGGVSRTRPLSPST